MRRRTWLALGTGMALGTAVRAAHAQRFLFGSPVDLLLPPGTPARQVAALWRGLQAMNDRWNAWKPGEVSDLNRALAAGRTARVSPALAGLIQGAAAMERLSGGCFNAGIGGLVGQWGFHDDVMRPGHRPAESEIARWMAQPPGLSQLVLRGSLVRSSNPTLQLDFGGYAKGVALDWALDRLQLAGSPAGLLNLGGNLAAFGHAPGPGGRPWCVGIRDPLGPGLVAQLDTAGREAVVTSGSYERFRVLDGQAFTHVLDPRTGAPAPQLVSVTVVHPSAALADAAATALLVAGPDAWPRVAAALGVDQVLAIDRHGRVQATPRLRPRLRFARA